MPPISAAFPFANPYKGIPKNNDSSIGPANTTESKYRGILGSTYPGIVVCIKKVPARATIRPKE
jgi:hypothetical protein